MIKDQIEELLRSTERPGIDLLLDYMDKQGFYLAPCSTQYHLNHEGGLAEHSLNVCQFGASHLLDLIENLPSWIIVSLLHDLGKMGHHGKPNYVPNVLKGGKISDSKPYEVNKSLASVPHEVESIAIAERFIDLTEEEEYAILMHNGLYGDFKYEINGKERPLQMLLHFADLWCSRIIEKEDK